METLSEIKKGTFYIFISRYSRILIQLLVMAVLARQIMPEDFGVIAIAMVFVLFFNELGNAGIGTAIVQLDNLSQLQIDSFFWFTFFQALFLTLLFLISAPLISSFYNLEGLTVIFIYLSISVFFSSLSTVPFAINRKYKRFKQLGVLTVSSNLITGLISILLAIFLDQKIYALVFKVVIESVINFSLNFYLSKIKIKLNFSFTEIKKVFNYSMWQFFYNISHYSSRSIDNLFIGKFMGASALGFYDKAYKLMVMPIQNLSNVISPVLHPVLSGIKDDKTSVLTTYHYIIRFLSLIGFPLSVYLFFNAEGIIYIIYGSNWGTSVAPFKILSLSVGFQMLVSTSRAIFQTLNSTKTLFLSSFFSIVVLISLLLVCLYFSFDLVQLCILILIFYVLSFVITFYFLLKYALKERLNSLLDILIKPFIISIILFMVQLTVKIDFNNIYINFSIKSLFFLVTYISAMFFFKEYLILSLFKKYSKKLKLFNL